MTEFPHLLSPLRLGPVEIPNRVVFAAHGTKLARDSVLTDELIAYHEERARGGAGLIVLEFTVVHDSDLLAPAILAGHREQIVPTYRRLQERLRPHGTRAFVQLSHRGAQRVAGAPRPPALGPSAVPTGRYCAEPRALTEEEIEELIDGYGAAARNAAAGGLDGIEITVAHNLLVAQFLSPLLNRRSDRWAAGPAFLAAVLERVRAQAPELALGVRFSAELPGADAAAAAVRDLVDYVSITLGDSSKLRDGTRVIAPPPIGSDVIAGHAERFKVGRPLMISSRIVDPATAEQLVADGVTDAVAVVRALLADPDFVVKAGSGRAAEIFRCIGCGGCSGVPAGGGGLCCSPNPRATRELTLPRPRPAERARRLVVVGGGPAGIAAASDAAQQGHRVTLLERSERLGGQLALAAAAPTQREVGEQLVANAASLFARHGVEVRFGIDADEEAIAAHAPDAVVVATGAEPFMPAVDSAGIELLHAWDVLGGRLPAAGEVVVADWGGEASGLACAEVLAAAGRRVTLAVASVSVGEPLGWFLRDIYLERLYEAGVEIEHHQAFAGAGDGRVRLRNVFAPELETELAAGAVVLSQGRIPCEGLAQRLLAAGVCAAEAGDCRTPRTLREACLEGVLAARELLSPADAPAVPAGGRA